MPINVQELIYLLAEILEEKNLKATLTHSLEGGLLTGGLAMLGGILLGPIGLAVGGALGGTTAALTYKNSFKPVAVVLKELPLDKKHKLCNRVEKAFKNFGIQDVVALTPLLLHNISLQELAIQEVRKFLTSEMGYSIQS